MQLYVSAKSLLILGTILAVLLGVARMMEDRAQKELEAELARQEYVQKVKDLQRNGPPVAIGGISGAAKQDWMGK